MTTDPQLRVEVEAARAWGVPWSVLTGDRSPGDRWGPLDAAYAVALQLLEGAACPGCGQDRVVSMSAASEFTWAATPVRCHACAVRERRARAMAETGADTAGLKWIVKQPEEEGPRGS